MRIELAPFYFLGEEPARFTVNEDRVPALSKACKKKRVGAQLVGTAGDIFHIGENTFTLPEAMVEVDIFGDKNYDYGRLFELEEVIQKQMEADLHGTSNVGV